MATEMTEQQAHHKARIKSLKEGITVHVIYDAFGWDIATEGEMQTFYNGARSRAVYFCGDLESQVA